MGNNKDKIIQIIVDSDGSYTGLSESGKMYDFVPQRYLMKDGKYVRGENNNLVIDPERKAHWELVIDSPESGKR